jgi:hypothetical protein
MRSARAVSGVDPGRSWTLVGTVIVAISLLPCTAARSSYVRVEICLVACDAAATGVSLFPCCFCSTHVCRNTAAIASERRARSGALPRSEFCAPDAMRRRTTWHVFGTLAMRASSRRCTVLHLGQLSESSSRWEPVATYRLT